MIDPRRFRHHAWAGATLARSADGVPSALRPLAHALTADRVWSLRLAGAPTAGIDLWPDLDGAACRALVSETTAALADAAGRAEAAR